MQQGAGELVAKGRLPGLAFQDEVGKLPRTSASGQTDKLDVIAYSIFGTDNYSQLLDSNKKLDNPACLCLSVCKRVDLESKKGEKP
jgi:hypothetical protein